MAVGVANIQMLASFMRMTTTGSPLVPQDYIISWDLPLQECAAGLLRVCALNTNTQLG